jgi:hypothetical protein
MGRMPGSKHDKNFSVEVGFGVLVRTRNLNPEAENLLGKLEGDRSERGRSQSLA